MNDRVAQLEAAVQGLKRPHSPDQSTEARAVRHRGGDSTAPTATHVYAAPAPAYVAPAAYAPVSIPTAAATPAPGSDPTVKMTGQRAVTTGAGPAVQPSEARILTAGSGSGSLADGVPVPGRRQAMTGGDGLPEYQSVQSVILTCRHHVDINLMVDLAGGTGCQGLSLLRPVMTAVTGLTAPPAGSFAAPVAAPVAAVAPVHTSHAPVPAATHSNAPGPASAHANAPGPAPAHSNGPGPAPAHRARRGPDPQTIIGCFESPEIVAWLIPAFNAARLASTYPAIIAFPN
ncbi:hypothetical protein FB45DRAFT_872943 [Roridomyces roridus]|uniref:Uncharacterized protein n=1 Tax=Roridomyces roridus TaxID=1738132 RepID=A0AAD7FCV7_9AGAR|nr:hypothetical protein FB45DRAFT_872943 [Roridomyces roridus]